MANCPVHESCSFYIGPDGPMNARLVILGEGPGAEELRHGRFFIGPSGKLLDRRLEGIGIKREDVLVYNAVPCFNSNNPRTPNDKDIKLWKPHIMELLLQVRPDVIVTAGGWATGMLTGKRKITSEQGAERRVELAPGYEPWVMPSFHPAATMHDSSKTPAFEKTFIRLKNILEGTDTDWYPGHTIVDTTTLDEAVAELSKAEILAFDLETTGDLHVDGRVLMVGLGQPDHKVWVFPVGYEDIPYDERVALRGGVRAIFDATRSAERVAHNGKYDVQFLKKAGMVAQDDPGVTWDGVLIGHLLDETKADQGRLKLKVMGEELFGIQRYWVVQVPITMTKTVRGKTQTKTVMTAIDAALRTGRAHLVPMGPLAEYNARDVALSLKVREKLDPELRADSQLVRLYDNLVLPASRAMEYLERAGLPVDEDMLNTLGAQYTTELQAIDAELDVMFPGMVTNWNSDQQLRKVLYEHLGLPVMAYTKLKNAPSVDTSTLMLLKGQHAIIDVLLRRSEADKRVTTVQTLREHIAPDGRIHPTFVVAGPTSGRTASRDPNMQNLERPDPEKDVAKREKTLRDVIATRPGMKLVELDYNLMEMRWGSFVYNEQRMKSLMQQNKDVHRHTATVAFGRDQVNAKERQLGKHANFLLLFAGGPDRLATQVRDNGLTEAEATTALVAMGRSGDSADPIFTMALELWKAYHRAYPDLRAAHERVTRILRKDKQIRTAFGRVRRLPMIDSTDRKVSDHASRQGINTIVQGPASDTALLGLITVVNEVAPKYGARVINAVHDSILAEVSEENLTAFAGHAKMVMENPDLAQFDIKFDVPILVDVKAGDSWGSLSPLEEENVQQAPEIPGPAQDEGGLQGVSADIQKGTEEAQGALVSQSVVQPVDMFAAALTYLSKGWSVIQLTAPGQGFPAGGKAPAIDWKAYQSKQADINQLKSWFGKNGKRAAHAPSNIGIVTGSISKLVVVDIDSGKGGDKWLKDTELDSPAKVRTGGEGLHLYFSYEGPPLSNRAGLAPGVDIRAEGGQVAAPPSLHQSGRRYRWQTADGLLPSELPPLPEWLAELINKQVDIKVAPNEGGGRTIPPEKVDDIVTLLEPFYTEGERHALQLALTGFLAKRNYQAGDVEELVTKLAHATGDVELHDRMTALKDTYEKVKNGAVVAGSDALRELTNDETVDQLEELFGSLKKVGLIEVMHGPAFVAAKRPEVEWLVEGLLPVGGIWMLSGHPGAGKSTLALQLGFHLATGKDLWGMYAVPGQTRILYLQADNPPHMFASLVHKMSKRYPDALENMYFSNVTRPIKVNTDFGYEALKQAVDMYDPGLIVLDTIRDFHSADENNPTAVAETLDALKAIRGTKPISIGFIHHHSKGSSGPDRMQIEKHMGSMRFVTPVDLSMSLTFDEKELGNVILRFTKIRWAQAQQPITLQRFDNIYEHTAGGV